MPVEIPTTCQYKSLFLVVPGGCLQLVIVLFPDHTHLLFLVQNHIKMYSNKRKCCPTKESAHDIHFDKTMHAMFKAVPK